MPRPRISPEEAVAHMRAAGFEPLEPYCGNKATPWLAQCKTCGSERKRYLHLILKGTGCLDCSGKARLSEKVVAEILQAAHFEPLEEFTSVDTPFLCRCLRCGREAPVYLKVVKKGGGCRKCAGNAPTPPDEAAAELRAAGFEPLEPYPGGVDKRWMCRCTTCGSERTKTLSAVRQGTGCGPCSGNVRYGDDEALAIMRKAGLEPLVPYRDARQPWESRCTALGHLVSPALSTVLSGRGCRDCARLASRLDAEVAAQLMRDHGFDPLTPYPGANAPWSCRCLRCGTVRDREYSATRRGIGCPTCSGTGPLDPAEATAVMEAGGCRPLVPYSTTDTKWKCECLGCGRVVYPRYTQIKAGFGGCAKCAGNARLDDDEAASFMRERGWEPLEPYPGQAPWKCRCLTCGTVRTPSIGTARKGSGCGKCSADRRRLDAQEAAEAMREFGWDPVEPYPASNLPWSCRCMGCGMVSDRLYSHVRLGRAGCATCRRDLSRPGSTAGVYVMVHEDLAAVKVGIGLVVNGHSSRVRRHQQQGWVLVGSWSWLRDFRVAAGVERAVLRGWRAAGIRPAVRPEDMPQAGYSETAPLSRVNVEELCGLVTVLIGEVADVVAAADEAAERSGGGGDVEVPADEVGGDGWAA